jgi:hypothetical protein
MAFKVFKVKKEVKDGETGKTRNEVSFVCKDGPDGTGQTLRFQCGFCKDKDGRPTQAFRSWRQRLRHANTCPR